MWFSTFHDFLKKLYEKFGKIKMTVHQKSIYSRLLLSKINNVQNKNDC